MGFFGPVDWRVLYFPLTQGPTQVSRASTEPKNHPPKKRREKKNCVTWCDGVTLASYSRGSKGLPELKGCSEPIHSAQVHTMQMAEVVLTPKFGQIDGVQPNPKTP